MPMLLTRELHERISRSEVAGIRSGIAAARRLYPDADVAWIDVAGGIARFIGVNPPLSQAFGVGALEPVTAHDVDRITEFYESRNALARVYVTPLSDPSLGPALVAAGYVPVEYENVLASDDLDTYALRDDRISIASDPGAWARASAQAFADPEPIKRGDERMPMIFATAEGVTALEARDGGTIAATSVMAMRDECAMLFAGSTLSAFRGRGWHVAMIRDRIARGRDAGANVVRAIAQPASESERNLRRCGFDALYTRILWERR
jgi:hypothetical protein